MSRLIAAACLALLGACQVQPDVAALLGSGIAATSLSYLVKLDPTVSGYLAAGDAAVAADAGRVLSVTCGFASEAHFVAGEVERLTGTRLISAARQAALEAGFAAVDRICPPNAPPPTNLAQAALEVVQVGRALRAALAEAGVKL